MYTVFVLYVYLCICVCIRYCEFLGFCVWLSDICMAAIFPHAYKYPYRIIINQLINQCNAINFIIYMYRRNITDKVSLWSPELQKQFLFGCYNNLSFSVRLFHTSEDPLSVWTLFALLQTNLNRISLIFIRSLNHTEKTGY